MITVERNGLVYEVDGESLSELPKSTWIHGIDISGNYYPVYVDEYRIIHTPRHVESRDIFIAWRPIVAPIVRRWRAEIGGLYFFIEDDGTIGCAMEDGDESDNKRYSIGNYFRTKEGAEASNKAKIMRDPESER